MQLLISSEQDQVQVSDQALELIRQALEQTIVEDGGDQENVEVSLVLVDDPRIAALNEQYRGVQFPTDVLSFPLLEGDEDEPDFPELEDEQGYNYLLGDIVISVPRALEQATHYGHPLEHELSWLAVHGMFHLLGYDHSQAGESAIMRAKEAAVLAKFGIERLWLEADADADA